MSCQFVKTGLTRTAVAVTGVGAILDFDFRDPEMPMENSRVVVWEAANTGVIHAVAFWFRLDLDDVESLSTSPDNETTCWKQAVQFCESLPNF